jgi:hypothetical protein
MATPFAFTQEILLMQISHLVYTPACTLGDDCQTMIEAASNENVSLLRI